jgi:hypothetical protein
VHEEIPTQFEEVGILLRQLSVSKVQLVASDISRTIRHFRVLPTILVIKNGRKAVFTSSEQRNTPAQDCDTGFAALKDGALYAQSSKTIIPF